MFVMVEAPHPDIMRDVGKRGMMLVKRKVLFLWR